MKSYMKASVLLATGTLLAASLLTACAPLDAFKPDKPEDEVEEQTKLVLPENLSEALAELLILAMESDQVAVFGNAVGSGEINVQGFINLFDQTGQGVIQGVSSQKFYRGNTREDGNGADKFEVQLQVFARGAGLNRELTFGGELMNSVDERTLGFVELEKTSPEENLNSYLDCLSSADVANATMVEELKRKEAFEIKAFAACFDLTCDTVVVKLQLQNQGDVMLDSRVGLAFEDRNTPGQKDKDQEVRMSLSDASLKDLMTYSDAQDNRQAQEDILPQCRPTVEGEPAAEEAPVPASLETEEAGNADVRRTDEETTVDGDLTAEIREGLGLTEETPAAEDESAELADEDASAELEIATEEVTPDAEEEVTDTEEETTDDEEEVTDGEEEAADERSPEERAFAPFAS